MALISFEFFPPSTSRGQRDLSQTLAALTPLRPRFVSVTCGAGGGTRHLTLDTLQWVREQSGVDSAPHLICVGATRGDVDHLVKEYLAVGVRHIVALRGDPPRGQGPLCAEPRGYGDAEALVAGLKRLGVPEISVAAYPEVHPRARSARADLDNLKRKVDAGATRAITQFFFDVDAFLRFVDRARSAGIEAPIVPGILPVGNFARVTEFAQRCGARIPAALKERFAGQRRSPEELHQVATRIGADLCIRLLEQGIGEFHFYTMNRSALPLAICEASGLMPAAGTSATSGG